MTTLFVCGTRGVSVCGAECVGRLLCVCVLCVGGRGTGTAERGGGDDEEARSFYERGEQREGHNKRTVCGARSL